eukprot:GHRR01007420.1.p1 GENE.GHRR01007420.1~~GHRR01007420.1.p1  ORF type:complete len:356 (+),score=169.55 GHRR01007420.1:97-1164(+)
MADISRIDDSLTLSAAYQKASELCASSPSAGKGQVQEALDLLQHCEQLIQHAALFSSNEDHDDLATSHLKYLLVPSMKAELLQNQPAPGPRERLQQLQAAASLYTQFLQRCHQYGILGGSCKDTYLAQEQEKPQDPGKARTHKVERFKRSKQLATLLQQLNSKRQQADEEAGTESGLSGGMGGWDEEDERQLWYCQLEAATIQAVSARPLLQQEMQLVQHAVQQQSQQQGQLQPYRQDRQSAPGGDAQQRQQVQQQMMTRLAGIAGQLTLNDRQALKQQVFRPSHILPTLTVEQQGAIELAEMQQREAAQQQAAAEADARNDSEDEHESARQRAWDDFQDANPRGWGNSKLRPCA